MLKLLDCPNRVDAADLGGAPHAADIAYIDDSRDVFGYPTFVRWPAIDRRGDRIMVLIGFDTIRSGWINAALAKNRAEIQVAANAAYVPGEREVVLLAA